MTREVTLYLKYPGSQDALRRVQNSLLECVIEFKTGKEAVLLTAAPKELKSEYRLKGSVCLVDDELIVQFLPKHSGLHTVRIFSDTRELCRPVAFLVDQNCEVEGTSYSRPVPPTSAYVRKSPALSTSAQQQQQHQRESAFEDVRKPHVDPRGNQTDQQSPESLPQQPHPPMSPFREPPNVHPEAFDGGGHNLMRGFTSDPTLSPGPAASAEVHPVPVPEYQDYSGSTAPGFSPTHGMPANAGPLRKPRRVSYISGTGSRPTSMAEDSGHFSGDLHSMVPEKRSFDYLYTEKQGGNQSYGFRRDPLAFSHDTVFTPDTFKSLATRKKSKRKCGICTKKLKMSKLIQIGEDDFCESCFKRQYLIRSAIEHFMIPTVEECTVEVPVNKKSTKFITTRKTIPNMNLRGLDPNEVKYAQGEFKKFDMEGNGWISRALLFPLMKACFYYTLQDKEIKSLLSSPVLQSVIKSYGLDERDEVHEVEFLSLLAFIARERQRLKVNTNPNTKFTQSDLEMAYAFRQQFQGSQRSSRPITVQDQFPQSPQHTSPTHSMSPPYQGASPPRYQTVMSTSASMQPVGRQPQRMVQPSYRAFDIDRNPTDSSLQSQAMQHHHHPINLNASMVASPQVPMFSPMSIKRPASNVNPLQFSPYHAAMPVHGAGGDSVHVNVQQQDRPGGFPRSQAAGANRQHEVSMVRQAGPTAALRSLVRYHPDTTAVTVNTGFELPEEDRGDPVDAELPQLPPDKDPQAQTLTKPQPKKKANKEMMEELKLTGGISDGWMMY